MALNPIAFTENVVKSFLRYQFTTYAFADERLAVGRPDQLPHEALTGQLAQDLPAEQIHDLNPFRRQARHLLSIRAKTRDC